MLRPSLPFTLFFCSVLTICAAHANERPAASFPEDLPSRDAAWTFRKARELLRNTDYRDIPLNLVSRAEWKARNSTEAYEPMGEMKGIVIHHSETSEAMSVLAVQEHHQRVKKWADIGYHYIIAQFPDLRGKPEWRIFEGRPLTAKGAHAGRMNGEDLNPGQIGISIMGDFDPPKPTHLLQADPRAVYLLGLLVNSLMDTYGIQLKQIQGHGAGDHAIFPGHKSCPGQGSHHLVEALRSRYGMDSIDRTSFGRSIGVFSR